MADLGSSHLSSLLEAVPGIASVLRSPVADALLRTIRAAAGLTDYSEDDAVELIRYAVRRGLVGADEGDKVLAELTAAKKPARKPAGNRKPAGKKGGRPARARKAARPKPTASSRPKKKSAGGSKAKRR